MNDQAGAARLNSPVQMGSSNPLAPTMENPWQGMNHMILGSGNRVIQVQTTPISPTHSGPANSLPDDRRKRPRVSTENQVHNFNVNFPHPSSALESIKNDMIGLMETDHKLWQQVSLLIFVDYEFPNGKFFMHKIEHKNFQKMTCIKF